MPGDIPGSQYGAVDGGHSYAVTGVANAGSYVVAIMCLRLQLIVPPYSADAWLEEWPYLPEGGWRTVYHISYGDLFPEFAVVAVRFRTWHAQDTASTYKGG